MPTFQATGPGGSAYAANAQSNYDATLAGYQQVLGQQQAAQAALAPGYWGLYASTLAGLQGADASQRQQIEDEYAKQAGSMQQSMISRGLGNSTVTDAMSRGLLYDKAKAETGVANTFANTIADYGSRLGLSALGFQAQAIQNNAQLGSNMWNTLGQLGRGPSLGELSQGYQSWFGGGGGGQATDPFASLNRQQAAGAASAAGGGGYGDYGGGKNSASSATTPAATSDLGSYGGGSYGGGSLYGPSNTSGYGGGGDWSAPTGSTWGDYGGSVPSEFGDYGAA